jgi:acetyl esterase/lipase
VGLGQRTWPAVLDPTALLLGARGAEAQETRTVCTGDLTDSICMPMHCVGERRSLGTFPLMKWSDLYGRPKPTASARIAYGALPQQVGDLWLPDGPGLHPLVLMIHGGCWTKSIANLEIMNWVADDLRQRGIAVWNIEYRGVDEPGGGYPGTYEDVASGLDAARAIAASHHLSLHRVVVVGHSAGGHLALWAAARRKLLTSSPLYTAHPLKVDAVVDLAGLADLETDTDTACGPAVVAAMAGPPSPERPDVYADTSPAALAPLYARQFVIHGADDVTVKPEIGVAYAAKAQAAGDSVTVLTPPGGHVEAISPGTESWSATAALIARLVK